MVNRIEPHEDYNAGESTKWEFTVEEDGSVKPIGGSTLEWYLVPFESSPDSDAEISHSDSGVSITLTTDGSDGRLDLQIDQGVTDDLQGTYWQRLIIDDSGDGLQKWGGPFPIR